MDPNQQRAALLRDRNFRWLMGGGTLSLLGDQFTLIALPWLVLTMTGDTMVLGAVLALISVPRAVFILVGGAMVDRYSPQRVLMLTKYVNTLLLGALAVMVFMGTLSLPVVYALSLGIGIATAFSIPSGTAMMPHVVAPEQLQAANSLQLGMRQLSMFVGPLLAGLLIVLFGDGASGMANAQGIAFAFGFDALSFALSAWTLAQVVTRESPRQPAGAPAPVWSSIAEGLRAFWRDVPLRTLFLYWGAVAVLIMGPVHIALPVLASSQSGLGAAALGVMIGAHGAGTLLGMVASGIWPRLRIGSLGSTVLAFDVVVGLLFIPMGQVTAAWQGAALMLSIGVLGGFMQVAVFTWIQQRVPKALLGRAMSLFMFIFMGLAPMSAAVTGWVMKGVTLGQLFAGCGGALVVLAALAFIGSQLREVSDARPYGT
jgi:MFS family permease